MDQINWTEEMAKRVSETIDHVMRVTGAPYAQVREQVFSLSVAGPAVWQIVDAAHQ